MSIVFDKNGNLSLVRYVIKGMVNVKDPAALSINDAEVSQLVNLLPSSTLKAYRRPGKTRVLPDKIDHCWSNGAFGYVVSSGYLSAFAFDSLIQIAPVATSEEAAFCQVNKKVVYSNGIDYFLLEGYSLDVLDLPSKNFEIPVLPGTSLALYNGRLYIASERTLMCTKTYSLSVMDERKYVVDYYASEIRAVKALDTGLLVFTENAVYYLGGADPFVEGGFTRTKLFDYGFFKGSFVETTGDSFPVSGFNGSVVLGCSEHGVFAFGPNGQSKNLSAGQVVFPVCGKTAAAIVRINGEAYYILTVSGSARQAFKLPEFTITSQTV